MSFKAHPELKGSGFHWFGEIPRHWEMRRLRFLFELMRRQARDEDEIVTCFRDGEVTLRKNRRTEGFTNALKEIGYQGIRRGDLVIHAMDAFAGAIGVSDSDGKATPVYSVCKPFPGVSHSRYYGYLLRNIALDGFITSLAKGIRERSTDFRWADASDVCVPLPPLSEQEIIAAFLDHETAKIDALIAEQQRLIELLKEKRQAVISHAVTKGLNPNAPMKDSGVEWLGEVPAHWEVTRLKFVSRIVDCKNRTPEYIDGGEYLVVRTSNIKNKKLELSNALYTDYENFKIWTLRGVPPEGSILFTREAPAGEVCLVPEHTPLCMGQRMMNIIPSRVDFTSFLFDYLTSDCLIRYIDSEASGSTVTHLRVEQVYNIPVVVPPLEEQEAIDEVVSRMKGSFLLLIEQAEGAVDLLKERRAALISSAVTGKIDVRSWQVDAGLANSMPMAAEEAAQYG